MDSNDNLDPSEGGADRHAGPPTAPPAAAAWYRRPWGVAALAVVGVAAVVGLTLGAVALSDDDDAPVAADSPSAPVDEAQSPVASVAPSATPTSTPTPTTEPQPEPEAPAAPALAVCGTPAPVADGTEGLWVGDYGGGMEGDVMLPLTVDWALISPEDWSTQSVTASITGLWLVSEDGVVVAVPASEPPESVSVTMRPGSEGGGSGSEGVIEVDTEFVACPEGTGGLPPAQYRARISVQVSVGATTQTAWGDVPFFLPDYDTATGA